MFYDHALLTSRKHGVATIWLAATLGAQSRKVNRKAVLEVNIEKACEVISEPDVPLALRLSGCLLYGISRVYFKKCDYVLIDAMAAQNNIKTLWKLIGSRGLDPKAGLAKPEQLIVPDDPAFMPDDFIPTFDLDIFAYESTQGSSQRASAHSGEGARASSEFSIDDPSVLGLVIPTSESENIGGLNLPGSGRSSAFRERQALPGLDDEDGFDPHVGFEFDAEGNIFDTAMPEIPATRERGADTRLRSDSGVSARVRQEHEQARLIAQQALGDEMDGNFAIPPLGEEYQQLLPEAEAFPEMVAQESDQRPASTANDDASEYIDVAPVRRRQGRRPIPVDKTLQIRNAELASWNENYVENMEEAREHKAHAKLAGVAKEHAAFLVLGRGINNVGSQPTPFTAYHGPALYEMLSGKPASESNGKKRSSSPSSAESPSARHKRVRPEDADPPLFRSGPGQNEDPGADEASFPLFDDTIEVGRDADPLPNLEEHSSQMPWNPPSSRAGSHSRLGSAVPGSALRAPGGRPSSSVGFGVGIGNQAGSAASLSSPLRGDGTGILGFDSPEGGVHAHDRESAAEPLFQLDLDPLQQQQQRQHQQHPRAFEMWGPAAAVDTQTASASQWVREALETETENFLAFVRSSARVETVPHDGDGGGDGDGDGGGEQEEEAAASAKIWFSDLLPPAQHSRVVATQGFMHVLSLAGRGLLRVRQEEVDVGAGNRDRDGRKGELGDLELELGVESGVGIGGDEDGVAAMG